MPSGIIDGDIGRSGARRPDVSVVVVIYNIPREAPRTLLSLSATYQRNIGAEDYEVIVVDNGSNPPFDATILEKLPGNFRLIRLDPASPSPARAINRGLAEAEGDVIGVMIDGARIATPGLLHFARHGARLYDRAVVATLGWYLGCDFQRWSMLAGYNEAREDALLATIDWPRDGYRLFEIATFDESSIDGWLFPLQESNGLFLKREMWTALGGFDERFDAPGGGLVNLDTFLRAVELPDAEIVILLGEGTFHQIHGGVATNVQIDHLQERLALWRAEHEAIRGRAFKVSIPKRPPTYLGTLPQAALARFVRAAFDPVRPRAHGVEPPLGAQFDRVLWALTPTQRPADPTIARLVDLAHAEFAAGRYDAVAAITRLTCNRAPDEPEPQRLLSLVAGRMADGAPPIGPDAEYHRTLATAYSLLGQDDLAATERWKARNYGRDPEAGRVARLLWRLFDRSEWPGNIIAILRHPFSLLRLRALVERLKRSCS